MPYPVRFTLVILLVLANSACERTGPTPDEPARPTPAADTGRTRAVDAVVGKTWQWIRTVTPVETFEAADPSRYTLALDPGGRAAVRFDCNRGGGDYEIAEGKLEFGALASTRMACPPDSQDAIYAKELSMIRSFFVEDGRLYLEMPMDGGTMHFEPADNDQGNSD